MIDFQTEPSKWRHWRLAFDGPVATLAMDVAEDGGLDPSYELKLNSYDLAVDIELYDAVQRLRFEHPEVRTVVLTSGKERIFSAGANIRMLAGADHVHKVNFCKFTNETRLAIEDAARGTRARTYLAPQRPRAPAVATSWRWPVIEIVLVDDGALVGEQSAGGTPLLAVLPGTGGLTRAGGQARVAATTPMSSAPSGGRGQGPARRATGGWSMRSRPRSKFHDIVDPSVAKAAGRIRRPQV